MRQRGFGWLHLIIILAVVGAIVGAVAVIYQRGYSAGEKAVRLEWEQAVRDQREQEMAQAGKASTGLEAQREKERVVTRTITEQVDRLVIEYRDRPCLDHAGLCLANAAINGKGADSCKPSPAVPGVRPAPGRSSGLGLTLDYGDFRGVSGLRQQAPGAG